MSEPHRPTSAGGAGSDPDSSDGSSPLSGGGNGHTVAGGTGSGRSASGGALGYLTAFPAGASVPNTSTINAPNGGVVGSAAIVPAGTNGAVSVFSSNVTDLLIDISGYFAP